MTCHTILNKDVRRKRSCLRIFKEKDVFSQTKWYGSDNIRILIVKDFVPFDEQSSSIALSNLANQTASLQAGLIVDTLELIKESH
jgi:hypothetical protein